MRKIENSEEAGRKLYRCFLILDKKGFHVLLNGIPFPLLIRLSDNLISIASLRTQSQYGETGAIICVSLNDMLCPSLRTRALLGSVKDDLGLRKPGVYKIPCHCGKVYIGQTIRTIHDRCVEHQRHTRLFQPEKSAVAEHCLNEGHNMSFKDTQIIAPASRYWDCVLKEAIEIRLSDNLINREKGFPLSKTWNPILSNIKKQRSSFRPAYSEFSIFRID